MMRSGPQIRIIAQGLHRKWRGVYIFEEPHSKSASQKIQNCFHGQRIFILICPIPLNLTGLLLQIFNTFESSGTSRLWKLTFKVWRYVYFFLQKPIWFEFYPDSIVFLMLVQANSNFGFLNKVFDDVIILHPYFFMVSEFSFNFFNSIESDRPFVAVQHNWIKRNQSPMKTHFQGMKMVFSFRKKWFFLFAKNLSDSNFIQIQLFSWCSF